MRKHMLGWEGKKFLKNDTLYLEKTLQFQKLEKRYETKLRNKQDAKENI